MTETLKEIALNEENEKLRRQLQKCEQELKVTDELLTERQKVLDEIPECKAHGRGCVPHAIQWVKKMKAMEDAVENRHWEKEERNGA